MNKDLQEELFALFLVVIFGAALATLAAVNWLTN